MTLADRYAPASPGNSPAPIARHPAGAAPCPTHHRSNVSGGGTTADNRSFSGQRSPAVSSALTTGAPAATFRDSTIDPFGEVAVDPPLTPRMLTPRVRPPFEIPADISF